MKVQICFNAGEADLILEVEYDFQKGYPQTWHEPGQSDHCEINAVVLEDVDEDCVDLLHTPPRVLEIIGQMCLDASHEEIGRLTLAAHYEACRDAEADRADYERDARRDEPLEQRDFQDVRGDEP